MASSITIKENETLAILNELKKRGQATSFDLADATGINRDRVKLIMQRASIWEKAFMTACGKGV